MTTLDTKMESLLFFAGEPYSRTSLAKILEVTEAEIDDAASRLMAVLGERGIRLLVVGNQYELVTAPETSEIIAKVRKEEMTRDLGKAGAETLSIVLYRGPVTRAQIEYVRGVNCSFVLRNLLIRGLVDRIPHPENARMIRYQATTQLLKHLGVSTVAELPDYEQVQKDIEAFEQRKHIQEEEQHALNTPPNTT